MFMYKMQHCLRATPAEPTDHVLLFAISAAPLMYRNRPAKTPALLCFRINQTLDTRKRPVRTAAWTNTWNQRTWVTLRSQGGKIFALAGRHPFSLHLLCIKVTPALCLCCWPRPLLFIINRGEKMPVFMKPSLLHLPRCERHASMWRNNMSYEMGPI